MVVDADEIARHDEWYREYKTRYEKNKNTIQRWKEEKQQQLQQQFKEIIVDEPTPKKRMVSSWRLEELKKFKVVSFDLGAKNIGAAKRRNEAS